MINRLLLAVTLVLFGMSCSAAENAKEVAEAYEAGKHYEVITPALRTSSADQIEVAEFFWYGCSHCYTFEPMVQQWRKTIGEDVTFRGLPAIWQKQMDLHARAYYTADALGVLDTMHEVLFKAMNVDSKRLASASEVRELFTANGVSADDFDKTLNSFGVSSQVRQGVSIAKSAKVSGTPSMMVNGKYLINARSAGGQAGMLKVVDYLIAQERAAIQGS